MNKSVVYGKMKEHVAQRKESKSELKLGKHPFRLAARLAIRLAFIYQNNKFSTYYFSVYQNAF